MTSRHVWAAIPEANFGKKNRLSIKRGDPCFWSERAALFYLFDRRVPVPGYVVQGFAGERDCRRARGYPRKFFPKSEITAVKKEFWSYERLVILKTECSWEGARKWLGEEGRHLERREPRHRPMLFEGELRTTNILSVGASFTVPTAPWSGIVRHNYDTGLSIILELPQDGESDG